MKLHRVLEGKVFGGVCTGLAKGVNIDVAIVRLIFIMVAILTYGWLMVMLYLLLWFTMATPIDAYVEKTSIKNELAIYFSALLIGSGILMLLNVFLPFNLYKFTLPLGFIIIGVFMLIMAIKSHKND